MGWSLRSVPNWRAMAVTMNVINVCCGWNVDRQSISNTVCLTDLSMTFRNAFKGQRNFILDSVQSQIKSDSALLHSVILYWPAGSVYIEIGNYHYNRIFRIHQLLAIMKSCKFKSETRRNSSA